MSALVAAVRLSDGTAARASATPLVTPRVAAGYYIGGNGNPGPDMAGIRWTAQTRYVGFSQSAAEQVPTSGWVRTFLNAGGWLNLVVELKSYASGGAAVGAQTLTVEGRTYIVPAMAGTRHPGRSTQANMWSYRQVMQGQCDGLIHRLSSALRTVPAAARVTVQLDSEVDTTNQFGTTSGAASYDWAASDEYAVDAYSYVIQWLRDPPAGIDPVPSNVTFSLGYAGQWSGAAAFLRTHPDALPVDFCMWNVYNRNANSTPATRLRETLAYRDQAGPRMRSLPIIVAEFGSSAAWPGGQAAYLDQWPSAVNTVNRELARKGQGGYVMTNWFGSNAAEWGKVPDADKPAFFAAMRRAYATSPFLVGA